MAAHRSTPSRPQRPAHPSPVLPMRPLRGEVSCQAPNAKTSQVLVTAPYWTPGVSSSFSICAVSKHHIGFVITFCKSIHFLTYSNPKEGQCQRMFKLLHNCTHLNASKIMLKILQARLQWSENFQMFKLDLENAEEPEIKLPTSVGL